MKNWRNGQEDVSPPLHHYDRRPAITRMRMGPAAIVILPGPEMGQVHPGVSLQEIFKLNPQIRR